MGEERDAEGWWGETEPAPGAGALHNSEAGFLDKCYHPRAWDEWGSGWQWLGTWVLSACIHTLWQVAMQPFLRLITGRESTFNPSVRLSEEEVSVFMFPWGQEGMLLQTAVRRKALLRSWVLEAAALSLSAPPPTFPLVELLLPCLSPSFYYFSLADAVCSSGRYKLSNKMDKYRINCVSSVSLGDNF